VVSSLLRVYDSFDSLPLKGSQVSRSSKLPSGDGAVKEAEARKEPEAVDSSGAALAAAVLSTGEVDAPTVELRVKGGDSADGGRKGGWHSRWVDRACRRFGPQTRGRR
jgi:hypothetical protein